MLKIRNFPQKNRTASAIEYSLIAVLVAFAGIAAMRGIDGQRADTPPSARAQATASR